MWYVNYDLGALSKSSISLTTPPQERPKSASKAPRDWLTFTASTKFALTIQGSLSRELSSASETEGVGNHGKTPPSFATQNSPPLNGRHESEDFARRNLPHKS